MKNNFQKSTLENYSESDYQIILNKMNAIQYFEKELSLEKNKTEYLHQQLKIADKLSLEIEVHLLKELRQKEMIHKEFTELLVSDNEKLLLENQKLKIKLAQVVVNYIDVKTLSQIYKKNSRDLEIFSDWLSEQLSERTRDWLHNATKVNQLESLTDWLSDYISESVEMQKELLDLHESNQTQKTQFQLRDYFIEKLKKPTTSLEQSLERIRFFEKIDSKALI